jgi:hypothetical protein
MTERNDGRYGAPSVSRVSRRRFLAGSGAAFIALGSGSVGMFHGAVARGAEDHGFETGVSYFGSRDPEHVKRDMEDIVRHHCTFVVHTFSEADYHFYSEAMREVVRISRDTGLTVYIDPWGVGGVFGGEAFSRFVMEHPEETQRLADGTVLPAACLNRPAFQNFMADWINAAVETGADVLFWDEPHFYIPRAVWRGEQGENEWACRCDRCRELFQLQYGGEMPAVMTDEVIAFRDRSIVDFFADASARGAAAGIKNAVVMLPQESHLTGVSSWELIAAIDTVDIFGSDPYWYAFRRPMSEFVAVTTEKVINVSAEYGKTPQMWVQAYRVPTGREQELSDAISIIADMGVRNIAAWSYRGGAPMNLQSDNPDLVWEVLGTAYGRLRGNV